MSAADEYRAEARAAMAQAVECEREIIAAGDVLGPLTEAVEGWRSIIRRFEDVSVTFVRRAKRLDHLASYLDATEAEDVAASIADADDPDAAELTTRRLLDGGDL